MWCCAPARASVKEPIAHCGQRIAGYKKPRHRLCRGAAASSWRAGAKTGPAPAVPGARPESQSLSRAPAAGRLPWPTRALRLARQPQRLLDIAALQPLSAWRHSLTERWRRATVASPSAGAGLQRQRRSCGAVVRCRQVGADLDQPVRRLGMSIAAIRRQPALRAAPRRHASPPTGGRPAAITGATRSPPARRGISNSSRRLTS